MHTVSVSLDMYPNHVKVRRLDSAKFISVLRSIESYEPATA